MWQEAVPIQNNCKLPFAASVVHSVDILNIDVLTSSDAFKKTLRVQLDTKVRIPSNLKLV